MDEIVIAAILLKIRRGDSVIEVPSSLISGCSQQCLETIKELAEINEVRIIVTD